MNKRELQKIETRGEILKAAGVLFATEGFNNTSIQRIADECGLSKGAFYHHFSSKEEIVEVMCTEYYDLLLEAADPIIKDEKTPFAERLSSIISLTRDIGTRNTSFISEYLRLRHDDGNELLKDKLGTYDRKFYIDCVAPLLSQGKNQGILDFPSGSEIMAVIIQQIDKAVTEEIARSSGENNTKKTEEVFEALVYVLSRILQVSSSLIIEIIKPEEGADFIMNITVTKEPEESNDEK